MTAGTDCDDCSMAKTHVWPLYRAGCVGCGGRMTQVLEQATQPAGKLAELSGADNFPRNPTENSQ